MRAKTNFSCQACGHQSPRWLGRCPDCSGWNTMKEERQAPTGKGRPAAMKMAQAKATPIADIEVIGEDRRLTRIGEFDRVLGGGVIPGSVILIGGDPGIGKTTLLLQAFPRLSSNEEAVLSRYEWGHDDYSLKIENFPQAPACASHADRPPEPGQQGLEFS